MKTFVIILFVFMCAAQWLVPAKMIYDSESVVLDGTVYKFKTRPIDPSDPFRGKYIILSFSENLVEAAPGDKWYDGEEAYVTFTTDSAGFAIPASISHNPPVSGPYLHTKALYPDVQDGLVPIELPFDIFYLEESKASDAEKVYWEAQRDSAQVAYGVVRIGAGNAVLTDVMINDRSIVDVVKAMNDSPE
jgi:uncharacterized membrane-anchored protein